MLPTITKKFKDAMAGSALSLLTLAAGSLTASVQPAFAHRGAASPLKETLADIAIRLERNRAYRRNSEALRELAYEQQTSFNGDGRIVATAMETYLIYEMAPEAKLDRTNPNYLKRRAGYNLKLLAGENPLVFGKPAEEFEKDYNEFLNRRDGLSRRDGTSSQMKRSPIKAYYYATSNRVCMFETPSRQVCDSADKIPQGTPLWQDVQSIRAYRQNLMADFPKFSR